MEIQACLNLLCDGSREEKLSALNELRDIFKPKVVECLLTILEQEQSMNIKERVIILLKQIAFPKTNLNIVERMFKSDDPFTRNSAIELLKQADTDFLSAMARLSDDDDKDVRKFVLDTLVEHSSKEAVQIVEKCLNDQATVVRQAAVEALGNIGIKATAPSIEQQLKKEKNMMIKCTCLESLARLAHSPDSADIIRTFSQETNPILLFSFLRYLSVFGTPKEFPLIESFMSKIGNMIIVLCSTAITGILARFQETTISSNMIDLLNGGLKDQKDTDNIWKISRAVLFGKGKAALDEARTILRNGSEPQRLAAAELLERFGTQEDIQLTEEYVITPIIEG